MKKLFFVVLFLVISCTNVGSAEYCAPTIPKYSLEVQTLAAKVSALKEKYYLEYKSEEDLLDTCEKIVKYCKYEPIFNKWDVASIVIKESKFNPRAYNKRERVAGLMQITRPGYYWKDELFWYNKPYCKDQNIKAGLIVLKTFYSEHKTKRLAIKHYNGSTSVSTRYASSVLAIKQELRSAKI